MLPIQPNGILLKRNLYLNPVILSLINQNLTHTKKYTIIQTKKNEKYCYTTLKPNPSQKTNSPKPK